MKISLKVLIPEIFVSKSVLLQEPLGQKWHFNLQLNIIWPWVPKFKSLYLFFSGWATWNLLYFWIVFVIMALLGWHWNASELPLGDVCVPSGRRRLIFARFTLPRFTHHTHYTTKLRTFCVPSHTPICSKNLTHQIYPILHGQFEKAYTELILNERLRKIKLLKIEGCAWNLGLWTALWSFWTCRFFLV